MRSSRHYFAYGANMSQRVFVERRGMRPLTVEVAVLDGWELAFAQRGVAFVEPAFATIRPAAGGRVEGVLYRVDERELELLDRIEVGYAPIELAVAGIRSGLVQARAYRAPIETPGLLPSRRYLQMLVDGAGERGLSAAYRQYLAAHPAVHIPVLSPLANGAVSAVEALHRRGVHPLRLLSPLWWLRAAARKR